MGASIIIPAYNAEKTIAECLSSVKNQDWEGEFEIILVNDGSTDRTAEIAGNFPEVQVISVPNGGAPRATNIGIRAASHDIVISVDADIVLDKDWLRTVMPCFSDPQVGVVTGNVLAANQNLIGRLTGYHTELRIDRRAIYVDGAGSANTAYRRKLITELGFFDEQIKAGYDKDITHRISSAGYLIMLNKMAKCKHYWRSTLRGFLKQQYYYAFTHLDVMRKSKKAYNKVSTLGMILQVPYTFIIVVAAILGSIILSPWMLTVIFLLPLMHLPDTIRIFRKKKEPGIWVLPWLFTLKNLAWVCAACVWVLRLRWLKRTKGKSKDSKIAILNHMEGS